MDDETTKDGQPPKLGRTSSPVMKAGGRLAGAGGRFAHAGAGLGKGAIGKVGALGGALGQKLRVELELARMEKQLEVSQDAGFSLYILLRHLLDFEKQDGSSHAEAGVASQRVSDVFQESWFQDAKVFYEELVGSCEIINGAGELERVFFRYPKLCKSLSEKRKHDLEWKVDRETPGAQLIQFIEASDELHFEMVHENNLEQYRVWRFVKKRYNLATNSIFVLSMLANICLILRAQYCTSTTGEYQIWNSYFCSTTASQAIYSFANDIPLADLWSGTEQRPSNPEINGFFQIKAAAGAAKWEADFALGLQIACFVLGVLICVASVIVFVLNSFRHGYPRVHHLVVQWVKEYGFADAIHKSSFGRRTVHTFDDINRAVIHQFWIHAYWFYPMCAVAFMASGQLLFCMASFVASVISLTVSPYWFAFGLLDFASKSPEIRIVASVLAQNVRSIMMTLVFMLIVIYMFAVFGYLHLAEWFFYVEEYSLGDDQAIPSCTSLLQCFLTVLDDGLRANDIGANIEPVRSPDITELSTHFYVIYYVTTIYSLAFWFIVCIILLNIIFGIIIDSFGELRLHRQMIQGKINNECFICGIDRFTLDTQGAGFDRHCAKDHDKWNYLFLMVMLREKDPSEYNGWEQHVADQIYAVSSAWMPRNNAIALTEHKQREEAEVHKREEQATRTFELVTQMTGTLEQIISRQDELDKKVGKLQHASGLDEKSALGRGTSGRSGSSKGLLSRGGSSMSVPSPRG